MDRRKIRDRADARACLEAVAASGQERAEWAHANGVDARSLNAWRITLERRARRAAPRIRLVEWVPAMREEPEPARYRVHCGERIVEVDERFDEEVLRRLLAVVSTC